MVQGTTTEIPADRKRNGGNSFDVVDACGSPRTTRRCRCFDHQIRSPPHTSLFPTLGTLPDHLGVVTVLLLTGIDHTFAAGARGVEPAFGTIEHVPNYAFRIVGKAFH